MRTPNTPASVSSSSVSANNQQQQGQNTMRTQISAPQSASVSSSKVVATSASPVLKEVLMDEQDGAYMEIKYTIRRPGKGQNASLCTLIGTSAPAGNIRVNTKDNTKSLFLSSWLRPLVWSEGAVIDEETGELARTEVNAYLMQKSSTNLDPQLTAIVEAAKKNPEAAALIIGMLPTASQELVKAALANGQGWVRRKANVKVLLDKLFGHQSIRIKTTLYGDFRSLGEYIADLDWSDDEGHAKDYTLVIRFPLVESLNASAQVKQMLNAKTQMAHCVPGTDNAIQYKEVIVYPTYMAVLRGAERIKDLTKMVSTETVMNAFAAAWEASDETKKVFISESRLKAEANQINAWKEKIAAKTGKKWSETFKDELFALAPQVANGNPAAAKEAADILNSLQQLAAEGTHPRCDKAEADKFANAFANAVETSKSTPVVEPQVATPISVPSIIVADGADDIEDVSDDFAAPAPAEDDWSAILGGQFLDGILTVADDEE